MKSLARDRPVVLRGVRYLGGHPAAPAELDRIDMRFDDDGISFERRGEPLGRIGWDRVRDLAADAEATSTRSSVPRVWLFGVLGAFFPITDRHVLLRVLDNHGAWMFAVDGIRLDELRAGLERLRRRYPPVER